MNQITWIMLSLSIFYCTFAAPASSEYSEGRLTLKRGARVRELLGKRGAGWEFLIPTKRGELLGKRSYLWSTRSAEKRRGRELFGKRSDPEMSGAEVDDDYSSESDYSGQIEPELMALINRRERRGRVRELLG
ncbi:unnamed protein product [Auanema sp. JU1783]|nr:unnamed protein product [Auanema sp. JU1783]